MLSLYSLLCGKSLSTPSYCKGVYVIGLLKNVYRWDMSSIIRWFLILFSKLWTLSGIHVLIHKMVVGLILIGEGDIQVRANHYVFKITH